MKEVLTEVGKAAIVLVLAVAAVYLLTLVMFMVLFLAAKTLGM